MFSYLGGQSLLALFQIIEFSEQSSIIIIHLNVALLVSHISGFLRALHFLLLTSIFHTILIKIFFMTVSTECSWIKEPWIVFTKLDWFLINCLIYSSKKTRPNVGILILSYNILITHFSRRLTLNLLLKCVRKLGLV